MEDDDEENDCLYIAEDPELMLPVNSNTRELNAFDTSTNRNVKHNITPVANNEQRIQNNADTSPSNIVSLLKNFNLQQFRNNNPHIFDESNDETEQRESNGARVFCKDFARIPYDDGSNLLTPEYLQNSELYAHLVGDNQPTTMSVADVPSRNYEMSNKVFRPPTNNFNNNARCASDALKQLSQDAYRAAPQMISPNKDYENAHFDFNTNGFEVIGNPSTNIPLNSGYGIQGESMSINTPAAQNLNVFMPHPGGPSSTAHGTDVLFSNSDRLNASVNNFGSPVVNMHSNGPVPAPPRHSQDLYASEANRRQMYSHNFAAPNYGPNMGACRYACCKGPCAPKNMGFTSTPALPAGYIPRPLCMCPGPCNLHITGPLYPAVQAQPNNQTASRNLYGQALNGKGAIPRDDLYIVEDPITYATYQQTYLANMRRNSLATEQSKIKTVTKQHMVNNNPVAVMNQKPKAMATANATRAYTEINTNLSNGGVINVDSNFPANTITNHSTTTSFSNSCNMAQRDAHRLKNTVKNKRQTKTTKNTPIVKTKAVKKSPRARATKITKDHFQPKNANVGTHADKQNENLHQPTIEVRFPSLHGDVKISYNQSDANIMQAPLKHERYLQKNTHNNEAKQIMPINTANNSNKSHAPINVVQIKTTCTDINSERALIPGALEAYPRQTGLNINTDQSQHKIIRTVHQIITDAVNMAMQTNEQQTEIHNITEKVQTSRSTEYSLIRNGDSSVALSHMSNNGAAISRTPISGQLKTPTPFNTVEGSYNIESIDLTAESITFNPTTQQRMVTSTRHDKMSMNINNVQTPNTQHAGMSINSENAQIPLIMEPSSQHAEKLQTNMQQASMNMTTNSVQTLITEDNTTQQDNVYEIVKTAQASYIKSCEPLKSELQLSGVVIQARKASEFPFTAAKKMEHDSAELESKTNAFNAETGTPLDKICLANKAQEPIKREHSKIITNENFQKYKKEEMLITSANPLEDMKKHITQPAVIDTIGTTMPTNINQVKMCMSTETVQASMNSEVYIQSANKNVNVQSLQPLVPLNKNTEKEGVALYIDDADFELKPNSSKTEPDTEMEVSIQQDNTATNNNRQNEQIPLIMKKYPQLAERSTHLNKNQSDVTMTMQTSIQQTSMDSNTETVHTSISMGSTTQQASNSANMKALALLTSVTQASRAQTTSNTCNLNDTTTLTENITHNIVSTDFVSSSNNLNPITGLSNGVSRSDTIYDITQTQVTVQHHGIGNTVDQFSIDLKDLKSILDTVKQNSKLQNTKVAKTDSSAQGTKYHNENNEGTETIENEYATGTEISDGNISCKSKNDDENAKLKIARRRLALISMQNENRAVQSTSTKDNPQNSIIGEYDSIIGSVAKTANTFLPPYKISSKGQKKSVDETATYVTNTVKKNADIKSLEAIKRKILRELAIDANKKRYRCTADIKQKNNYTSYSRPVHKSAAKTDTKFHQADVAKHKGKNRKETNSTSHDDLFFSTRKHLRQLVIDASKKRYRCTTDIKQKNNYTSYSRPVQKSAAKTDTKFHQTDVAKNKGKNKKETNSTSHEDLFFSFQREFFIRVEQRLAKVGLQNSAYNLSCEIYRLMYIRQNKDAKADIEFTCPKCHQVSIYSPHLFYYKEDVHNLDDSSKTVHCQRCIRFRKKYKTALKRYIKQKTAQFEKINDDKDVGEIVDQPKIDDSNKNNADEDTINSNNELTIESANIHTQSDITDIEETSKRPEVNFDPIAEELSIITDGVPLFATIAEVDVQNNHNKIKLLVKLPCEMLKPSTVDSVIKLKHKTFTKNNPTLNIATNDLYNNDKNCIINREEQKTDSAKTATSTSNPPDINLNTTINKNYGNVDSNTENPVTIENADINTNIERSREVSSLNDVETTNSINAQLPKRNEKNTNDNTKNSAESATSRITQLSNKVMNTENTVNMDKNKNKISRKVRKSLSVETTTSTNVEMCEKNMNTKTNNNREKNNHKNRKARGKNHDDTAKRPDVGPKSRESNSDAQKNTGSRKNKYSASYRVSKPTEKNDKIIMKFINIFGQLDDDVSQIMNDNKDKNDNRGSETEDDMKSSSETDDDVNEAEEAISNSFNTLKNNSNEKSELPEVSGKMKDKISNKHKDYAKVECSYECHVCSVTFSYPRVYFRHMSNHGIRNKRIPEKNIYKKCRICGLSYVQGEAYNTHIKTCHEDIFNLKE